MVNGINSYYRYDFFIIWGNGLPYIEAILEILRGEDNIEIIRIESRQIKNMKKFVFDSYACDSVPIEHLRSKLRYLFKERSDIVIAFIKNLAPEENYFGEGAFRHRQCAYINRIKQRIRDLFNPRNDGVRTEEHVIHASDYEEQVDYFLRMLGHSEGIEFLHEDPTALPFHKPYHIPRPKEYTFRTLPIKNLRASILVSFESKGFKTKLVKVSDTPHFRSLKHRGRDYIDYLERFRYTLLTDDYSWKKLLQMNQLSLSQIQAFAPILVAPLECGFRILDGIHRAAVALNHNLEKIRCVEFGD